MAWSDMANGGRGMQAGLLDFMKRGGPFAHDRGGMGMRNAMPGPPIPGMGASSGGGQRPPTGGGHPGLGGGGWGQMGGGYSNGMGAPAPMGLPWQQAGPGMYGASMPGAMARQMNSQLGRIQPGQTLPLQLSQMLGFGQLGMPQPQQRPDPRPGGSGGGSGGSDLSAQLGSLPPPIRQMVLQMLQGQGARR